MREAPRKRAAAEPAATLFAPEEAPPGAARPAAIMGGTALVLLRAAAAVLWWIGFAREWPETAADAGLDRVDGLPELPRVALAVLLAVGALWTALLLLLARRLWVGSNTARVLTMVWMTTSITASAAGYFASGAEITVRTTLLTLALDILILLALSSRPARAWARGRRGRRRGAGPGTR